MISYHPYALQCVFVFLSKLSIVSVSNTTDNNLSFRLLKCAPNSLFRTAMPTACRSFQLLLRCFLCDTTNLFQFNFNFKFIGIKYCSNIFSVLAISQVKSNFEFFNVCQPNLANFIFPVNGILNLKCIPAFCIASTANCPTVSAFLHHTQLVFHREPKQLAERLVSFYIFIKFYKPLLTYNSST